MIIAQPLSQSQYFYPIWKRKQNGTYITKVNLSTFTNFKITSLFSYLCLPLLINFSNIKTKGRTDYWNHHEAMAREKVVSRGNITKKTQKLSIVICQVNSLEKMFMEPLLLLPIDFITVRNREDVKIICTTQVHRKWSAIIMKKKMGHN